MYLLYFALMKIFLILFFTFAVLQAFAASKTEDSLEMPVKEIKIQYVQGNWGFAFDLFGGYGIFTGKLSSHYKNSFLLGFGFDICYKMLEWNLRLNAGFSLTKENFTPERGKSLKRLLPTGLPETSLGFAVLDNNLFRFSPFLGIGSMSVGASSYAKKQIPELKKIDLDYTMSTITGANIYIKFTDEKDTKLFSIPFLRIRYEYIMPRFYKKYDNFSGNMHYISIGFGFFIRELNPK